MKKKPNKPQRSEPPNPARLVWSFAPDVPTEDFFDGQDTRDLWHLQEAVDNFIFYLEVRRFHTWEAVVAQEQGLPLTRRQKADLAALIDFTDGEDDRVLYIDEAPRPSQPWHVILNHLARSLLLEVYQSAAVYDSVQVDGWSQLSEALEQYAGGLSLPEGVQQPVEVVPRELRDALWLQDCCAKAFGGVGQEPGCTLADPEGPERIAGFVAALRAHPERVDFLRLDLATLLARLVLPQRDQALLLDALRAQLGLRALHDPLAPALTAAPPPSA